MINQYLTFQNDDSQKTQQQKNVGKYEMMESNFENDDIEIDLDGNENASLIDKASKQAANLGESIKDSANKHAGEINDKMGKYGDDLRTRVEEKTGDLT